MQKSNKKRLQLLPRLIIYHSIQIVSDFLQFASVFIVVKFRAFALIRGVFELNCNYSLRKKLLLNKNKIKTTVKYARKTRVTQHMKCCFPIRLILLAYVKIQQKIACKLTEIPV